ncbi:MAG: NurA protein, partial [Nitrosarchaeum sp.]|nr:NurA protein [Nitrosarchaeum sp.]
MNEDPVKSLIAELGAHLSHKEHSDVILNNGNGK